MDHSDNIHLDQLPPLQNEYGRAGPAPVSIVRVGASINSDARHHILSTIDQISPTAWVGSYLCFQTELDVDKYAIFNQLVQGLQHALAEFPHMTGRIVVVDSPAQGRAIEIDNFGVLVSLVDWTTSEHKSKWAFSTFAEIVEARFPMAHMPNALLLPQQGLANLAKVAPDRGLYIQVNFVEGGVILAPAYNHACCDGPGFSTFLETWAGYTREIAAGGSPSSHAVSFNGPRTIMSTGEDGALLTDFPFWKEVAAAQAVSEDSTVPLRELPQHSVWAISEAKLAELQATVCAETKSPLSKNDVLCALIWRHCALARGLHEKPLASTYTHSTLSCTVNTRTSMGLPARYVGNACEPNANTKLPIAALCASGNASLAQTAMALRASIKAVDSKAVRRLIGMLNTLPSPKSVTWNVDRWPGPDMLITNMMHTGRCTWSWGPLLNVAHVHRVAVSVDEPVDGRCYIFSRPWNRSDIEFLLSYPSRIIERLRRDQTFAQYVNYLG